MSSDFPAPDIHTGADSVPYKPYVSTAGEAWDDPEIDHDYGDDWNDPLLAEYYYMPGEVEPEDDYWEDEYDEDDE